MALKPFKDTVIIKRILRDQSHGGVYLGDQENSKVFEGNILATNSEEYKVGDHVFLEPFNGFEFKVGDEHFIFVKEEAIMGVLE